MTFWILLFVCLHGAQGCEYSKSATLRLDSRGSYSTLKSCRKEADAITSRYGDSDIYGRCLEVRTPTPAKG
jgi:hypothetical protein